MNCRDPVTAWSTWNVNAVPTGTRLRTLALSRHVLADCVNVEMTGFVDSIVALRSRRWSMTTWLGWSVWPTCSAGWK